MLRLTCSACHGEFEIVAVKLVEFGARREYFPLDFIVTEQYLVAPLSQALSHRKGDVR